MKPEMSKNEIVHGVDGLPPGSTKSIPSAEGLRPTEVASLGTGDFYRTLFEHANDAIFIHGLRGEILEVNRMAGVRLGYSRDELLRLTILDIEALQNESLFLDRIEKLQQHGHTLGETTYIRRDGKRIPIETSSWAIEYQKTFAVLCIARDMSERNRVVEMLRQSEELYRAVVEQAAEAIYLFDPETKRVIESNYAFQELLGYTADELSKLTIYDFVAHEKEDVEYHIGQVLVKKQHFHGERKQRRKDGTLVDVEVSANLINYSGRRVFCAVARNISDRKRAEKALQESEKRLRLLSSHLMSAQERERTRISAELHDELGQALMALKLHLRAIERKLQEGQEGLRDECERVLQYVDQTVENMRRLCRELSPAILVDLGLSDALRWLIGDFGKRYPIEISVDMIELRNLFSPEAEIIIYRIFQEVFNNILKHAQASHVSVVIVKRDKSVSFLVEDDGKGFNVQEVFAKDATERGLGIAAIDERIRMLGGSFDLWTKGGRGTRIAFALPIDEGRGKQWAPTAF